MIDTYIELYLLHIAELKKYFLRILSWLDYRKLKDALQVWCRNDFGNIFNKLNC